MTASILLSIVGFILLVTIIADPFRIAFNPVQSTYSPTTQNDLDLGQIETLALKMDMYVRIQSYNSWLIVMRILFELGFTREFSFVLDLLGAAMFDILFFCLMFALVYY